VISALNGAPRYTEASIGPVGTARYDGIADWYDLEFAPDPLDEAHNLIVGRLLGDGSGRLLDVGCGTGVYTAALAARGWSPTGVDVSADMLRRAQARGLDVVEADAAALPFADATFDAAVSTWTHTDIDDFPAVLREIARVLRPGAPFVYVGGHPCFVGPHAIFAGARGVPELVEGYGRRGRYTTAPGIAPHGLRIKVGAVHRALGELVQDFLDAGFALERFEEAGKDEYPFVIAMRWRR
jgi:SAM-dependent methyltransferase